MAAERQVYVPSMSDEAVKAKTGKDWAGWFGVLDSAAAGKLNHKAIVSILAEKHGAASWWRQMIAVEYERARGLRDRHETVGGFSVSISKTVPASLSDLYAAAADTAARKKWFPKGAFALSSATQDKYLRGSWKKDTRLDMGFYAKPGQKSQISIQVSKLPKKSDVESERTAWKAALEKLHGLLDR
jgi:hypothetical protein